MSGKTVVNIELKRELFENLPSITVCLPQIVLFESLAKYREEYQKDYEYFNEMLSEKYLSNSSLYNEIKSNLTIIYLKGIRSVAEFMSNEDFFHFVIDNLSLPYDNRVLSVHIHGNLQGQYLKN